MRLGAIRKILLFALALAGVAGCSAFRTYELKSQSAAGEIVIDANAGDWRGSQFFIEDQQLLLGIKNDSRFLYISIVAEGRFSSRQILARGLTVWFDPKGGKTKNWGIQYPLGLSRENPRIERRPGGFEDEDPEEQDREWLEREQPEGAFKELAIVKPAEALPDKMDVEKAKELGVEVAAKVEMGLFIYELRIPLRAVDGRGLAVGVSAGQTIGLGFEAGESKMRKPGGGMPSGGMGRPPMGGGRGGRGGGTMGEPGEGFTRPERLKIWAIVRLAEGGVVLDATPLDRSSLPSLRASIAH